MKLYKKIFLLIMFVFIVILFQNNSYAGTQKWNSLNYDVTVQENGDMLVIETWDIYVSNTNTLFENFDSNPEMYDSITDVKVIEITEEGERVLEQIYEEQYHVMPGCFYALFTSSGKYEIAWNVGLDNSSDNKMYKICYTVKNAVKVYNDCSELYWMFLKDTNTITGKNITGTITLPDGIKNIEKLRVWGHGPLSAEIKREDVNKVSFSVPTLKANEMLEVRVVSEENIFESAPILYEDKLEDILYEEQKWADEANSIRDNARKLIALGIVINILIAICFFIIIRKTIEARKTKLAVDYEEYDVKYFRDIPNEQDATPARAAYMNGLNNNSTSIANGKVFAATILDLVLKGIIAIEPIDDKNAKITIKKFLDAGVLADDENVIYRILKLSCEASSSNSITTKELEKYCKKNYESIYASMRSLQRLVEKYEKPKMDSYRVQAKTNCLIKGIIYISLGIFLTTLIMIVPALTIGVLLLGIVNCSNAKKIEVLTEAGYREKKEWKGLENYMLEFSLLKDKEVPDLILWEKYLVYATAFGISKKVLKQLKIVYPELMENSTYANGNYAYLHYIANSSYGFDFLDNLDKTLSKSYRAAESAYSVAHSIDSDGSGGGGGFSSGGRRRRRWRKLRRSLKYNRI